MHSPLAVVALVVGCLLGSWPALAERADKKKEAVETHQKTIDELKRGGSMSDEQLKLLQDLQNQVTSLRRDLDGLKGVERGQVDTRAKLNGFENRMGDLELKFSTLNLQLARSRQTSGYEKGFFIRSEDGAHLVRLNGLIQAGYLGRIYADERKYPGSELGIDLSTFQVDRVRVQFSGHVLNPRLAYALQLGFGSLDSSLLLDAYIEMRWAEALNVRGGKMKVPFGRQFIVSTWSRLFAEESGAGAAFRPGRDYGLMIHGRLLHEGKLAYQAGVFNGAGSGRVTDDNLDFLYAIRLSYDPLGFIPYAEGDLEVGPLRLSFGTAFTFNLANTDLPLRSGGNLAQLSDIDGDGKTDTVAIYTWSAEFVARLRGLSLESEFFYRLEDPGAAGELRKTWGFYAQAGGFHADSGMLVALRYGHWKPSYYGADRNIVLADKIHELAVQIGSLTWHHRIKWLAEYAHQWLLDPKSLITVVGETIKSHQLRLRAQLSF
jgi:phosphate-selective porin OprO/OprP